MTRPGDPPRNEAGPQTVFKPDGRTQVPDTETYPERNIGQLAMTFPNGDTYTGTGVVLRSIYVLTAAHNLYGAELGGFVTAVTFTPGLNGQDAPFGTFGFTRLNVPEQYTATPPPSPLLTNGIVQDPSQYIYDFGILTLDGVFDPQGEIDLYPFTSPELVARTFDIASYPSDKDAGTMWQASGSLADVEQNLMFYRIGTSAGEDGASLLTQQQGVGVSAGVHVGTAKISLSGGDGLSNFAVRLNQDNLDQIIKWM